MRALALAACVLSSALLSWGARAEPPRELPSFGADLIPAAPAVTEARTADGLTVWVVARPGIPKVSVTLMVRGGSAVDESGLEGMTELFAATLAEGTRTRSAEKIAEDLQAVGGELQADSSPDAVFLEASGLAGGSGRIIEIVADVARNAVFPDGEVALVKENLVERLAESEATPDFVGEAAFARAIFGAHPYRVTHAPVEVIRSVTPEILRREHARRFRADRALLVVVGDVAPAEIIRQARAAFAGWTASGSSGSPLPSPAPPVAGDGRHIIVIDRPGSVQSHILVGRLAPTMSDPDFAAALLGSTLFGGMGSARVITNLREDKGYSYSPNCQLISLERAGVLELAVDVRSEVTGAALGQIFVELDRMRSAPPSAEELGRARRYQVGNHLVRSESNEAVADALSRNASLGLGPRSPWELLARTEAVTLAELRRAGEVFFPSLRQTVVIVGDAGRLRRQLSRFGEITVQPTAR